MVLLSLQLKREVIQVEGLGISVASSVGIDQVNSLPEIQMMYAQGNNGVYGTTTPSSWGPKDFRSAL